MIQIVAHKQWVSMNKSLLYSSKISWRFKAPGWAQKFFFGRGTKCGVYLPSKFERSEVEMPLFITYQVQGWCSSLLNLASLVALFSRRINLLFFGAESIWIIWPSLSLSLKFLDFRFLFSLSPARLRYAILHAKMIIHTKSCRFCYDNPYMLAHVLVKSLVSMVSGRPVGTLQVVKRGSWGPKSLFWPFGQSSTIWPLKVCSDLKLFATSRQPVW